MKAFLVVLAGTLVTVLATHDPYHDVQPELPTIVSSKDNKIFVGGINPKENTTKYWHDLNIATIREKLAQKPKKNLAKNLILFLGDGMSLATLTAARMYLGQLKKEAGENSFLSFEKFPYTGFAKTYCADSQVADSACSATAYLTGAKGNIYTVGVTSSVGLMDWRNMKNESHHPSSLLKWAQDAGKGTGIISTCRITDASPAATYAHSAYRLWQTDHEMKRDIKNAEFGDENFSIDEAMKGLKDISLQMIENSPGNGFKVILGGGWDTFLPNTTNDEPKKTGARLDNRNLIQEWKTSKENIHKSASYVTNKAELLKLDIDSTDYVLGLFQPGNMQYHKLANKDEQPTLAQMTEFAIKMMKKEANGFVLFIEGGTIDVSHHENKAHLALDETVELHNAVEMAVNMTNENETLIVVTADHAHTMNINGYPKRGADIFNYVQGTADKLPYSTLSYANGPNDPRYNEHKNAMRNITTDKRDDPQYTFQTINLLPSETHDGQDVTVFARGPWAHLLVGNYEQTVIPYAMAYAAQIGPAKETNKKSQKES